MAVKNNNTTKNIKVKKYSDYNSREEKTTKLNTRKQAARDKRYLMYKREEY